MAVRVCRVCPTRFSADLVRCPRCTRTDFYEEDGDMPKTTKHGGASVWVYEPPRTAADTKGGEQSSDGNSSATSTEKPRKSAAPKKQAPRKRAQTTEHPSKPDPTADSTADTTDTSGPETDASSD